MKLVMISFDLISSPFGPASTYQNNQVSNNKFQASLHFIELVSKELGVDKSEVYVNTSADTGGTYQRSEIAITVPWREQTVPARKSNCIKQMQLNWWR